MKKGFESRKGQISAFIIIGIMLILIVSIVFFIRVNKSKNDTDVLDFSPEELLPVEKFVTNCVEKISKDGLLIIGKQGGYINLPENLYDNPKNYLQDIKGGLKTPLWKVNGAYTYPSLKDMNVELETYMNDNIKSCIGQITTLDSVQDFKITSEPKTTVSINKEDVSFILDLEIETYFNNQKTVYDKFGVKLPIKLFKMLESASFILQKNDVDTFLGQSTLNLMALDSENIPMGDMKLSCEPVVWSKKNIKNQLQDYLTFLIPRVKVSGSNYVPFRENIAVYKNFDENWDTDKIAKEGLPSYDEMPSDIYDYMQQYWDVGDFDFEGLNIGFKYDSNYGMNMGISPSSDSDILKVNPSKSTSKYLSYLCLNIYHFTYDVNYPVKVSLYDDTAFNGAGYTFSFAFPVNIDHNIPTSNKPNFFSADALQTDSKFCSITSEDPVHLIAFDQSNNEYISDVNFRYDCTKYYCDLGNTKNLYGVPEIETNFPAGCSNGFLIAQKPGYLKTKEQISESSQSVFEIDMLPLKTFNFASFSKGSTIPFTDDYSTTIYVKSNNYDFEAFYAFPSELESLELLGIEETYSLTVYLSYKGNFVGGWIGNWSVTNEDLNSDSIVFYPYESVDMVSHSTPQKEIDLYQYLEEDPVNNPYREEYYPAFK